MGLFVSVLESGHAPGHYLKSSALTLAHTFWRHSLITAAHTSFCCLLHRRFLFLIIFSKRWNISMMSVSSSYFLNELDTGIRPLGGEGALGLLCIIALPFPTLLRHFLVMDLYRDWCLIRQLQCRPWGRNVGISPLLKGVRVSTGKVSSSLFTCIVPCQTGCEILKKTCHSVCSYLSLFM